MKTRKTLALLLVLALMVGLLSMSAMAYGTFTNPLTLTTMKLTFGDTTNPTWPESCMYFSQESGNTYQAFYSTNGSTETTGYYPDLLSIYIKPQFPYSISSIVGTDVQFVTYDSTTGEPTYSTTTTVNSQGFYAICPQSSSSQIVITPSSGSGDAVTVKFKAPVAQTATGGTTPKGVCGYLPVGQFATGAGWGALCTNGTNNGDTRKFISGYISTGVSLGMLGGYVQFDLGNNTYITDNPNNPYGIDFIVYGNPFNGNPEAGSVMVSEDGKVWYNLAGSLHYDSDTQWNVNISYMKIPSTTTINNTTFTKGIYYSTNYVPTSSDDADTVNDAITTATWTTFVTGVNWWPEFDDENYKYVWSDGHIFDYSDDYTTGDVYWNQHGAAEVITYMGVTRVKDDAQMGFSGVNATNYYRFGYADVRQIGSSYGTAINPYASLPAASGGGDGFDLAWAVDTDGIPVNMTNKNIRFIRVYSAVLYNAAPFGETSAEVCGLYVAVPSGGTVGTTTGPSAVSFICKDPMNGSVINSYSPSIPSNRGTYSCVSTITDNATNAGVSVVNVSITAPSGANIYVNNVLLSETGTSGTDAVYTGQISKPTSGQYIRVIVQEGTKAPYMFLYT